MKLVFTPNPEYIHKVLVTAYEGDILDRLEFERTRPFDADIIWDYHPMGKVPALVMDNGEPLYGGLVICEYLDSLSTTSGNSIFPSGDGRWPALRQMTLGDGMFDATTLLRVEGWRDKADWNMDYMLRERRKIIGCLDQLNREVPKFKDAGFHIGHICTAGGLSYLDLRNPIREHVIVEGDETFDWREGRDDLAKWYDAIVERPSLKWRFSLPE
ncbi:MAG: glutathione S-transferase N-terminal domain-containing protein [Rhodospirillaceae bacterium]|jgi:glutathione S-transferase|nr:glutathione S-transferase N-terminal domain-containing protein [Rhodospirillaceae bacterium]